MKPLAVTLALLVLGGCAGSSGPAPQFYQLRLEAPQQTPPIANTAVGANIDVWQLTGPVRIPEYLERDVLWLPVGSAGQSPLSGHRWAEPLHEAVPRLLLHDLAQLHGAERVWGSSVPAGVTITEQLRLEILELTVTEDRRSVHLRARCVASDPGNKLAARVIDIDLSAPTAGSEPDKLVAAHRLALWMLAQQLAWRLAQPALQGRL